MNGIVLLNKPQGLTSNAALQKVKKSLGVEKAGHTGSLDPLATGMLPICLGEATKFSQYLLDADKVYEATGRLGMTTTTGDAWGEVVSTQEEVNIDRQALTAAISQFQGSITQVPPMFSALKHQGVPLYKLARKGVTVERKERQVSIYKLELLDFNGLDFSVRVHCSKGTYIRTLIESIGQALGVGAHVTVLHRVSTAGFESDAMYPLDDIAEAPIFSVESALTTLPLIQLTKEQAQVLYYGQLLKLEVDLALGEVKLLNEDEIFLGVGSWDGIYLRAKRLMKQI